MLKTSFWLWCDILRSTVPHPCRRAWRLPSNRPRPLLRAAIRPECRWRSKGSTNFRYVPGQCWQWDHIAPWSPRPCRESFLSEEERIEGKQQKTVAITFSLVWIGTENAGTMTEVTRGRATARWGWARASRFYHVNSHHAGHSYALDADHYYAFDADHYHALDADGTFP